nr:unnamed protein product [Callosobruchus chinensis]
MRPHLCLQGVQGLEWTAWRCICGAGECWPIQVSRQQTSLNLTFPQQPRYSGI